MSCISPTKTHTSSNFLSVCFSSYSNVGTNERDFLYIKCALSSHSKKGLIAEPFLSSLGNSESLLAYAYYITNI